MKFVELPLKGSFIVESEYFGDNRGLFGRIFCENEFKKMGLSNKIVQINHSRTQKKGAVRGMHYQKPPMAEVKMIKCVNGSVFDVMIDLRKNSNTFLQWHSVQLSAESQKMIYIPEGFAHGFQTLEHDSELIYLHTQFYAPDFEASINCNDPSIGIKWPMEIAEISEKDRKQPYLTDEFEGIEV